MSKPVQIATLGDASILDLPKVGFLSSRKVPLAAVIRCYDWATEVRDKGLPEIYPIPEVVDANGYVTVLYGTNDLGGEWTKITSDADRAKFHFFKIVIE